MKNFLQDHFSVPLMAAILPVINDAMKFGFDFKTLCLVGAMALGFSAIQAWHEVQMAKLPQAPVPPKP